MKGWILAGKVIGVGWYMGLCIMLGLLGGIWLDKKMDTGPLFIVLGLFLGLILAGCGVYHMLLPTFKDKD